MFAIAFAVGVVLIVLNYFIIISIRMFLYFVLSWRFLGREELTESAQITMISRITIIIPVIFSLSLLEGGTE